MMDEFLTLISSDPGFFFADVRYHIWIHGTILKRNSENVSLPSFISVAGKIRALHIVKGAYVSLAKE